MNYFFSISGLLDFICDMEKKVKNGVLSMIHLFSDSCSSQNKNSVMMSTNGFLERSKKFSNIIHSFRSGDIVTWLQTEFLAGLKKVTDDRKQSHHPKNIMTYYRSMRLWKYPTKTGKVRNLKESPKKVLWSKLPFKINSQPAIMNKKILNEVEILVKNTYSEI